MIGQRLGGKYLIQSEIGRGGMGIVYMAYDEPLQRRVAVKVLDPRLTLEPRFVRRFQQEAVAAANLRHPNIITIHDVGREATSAADERGLHYIVMDFVPGATLEQWVAKRGPMSASQAKHVIGQLASALDYAHARGMIHCDIKPANIMIDQAGHVTLMDFGLVRAREAGDPSRVAGLGTPEYMAPEQAVGGAVDARTDTYALGVVLYKLLAGRTPFERSTPVAVAYAHAKEPPPPLRQLRSDLPKEVEAVVLKALAKQPADRYQTASTLAAAFKRAAGQARPVRTVASTPSGGARVPGAQVRPGARGSRIPALWLAVSGLLLVLVVLGTLGVWALRSRARPVAPDTAARAQNTIAAAMATERPGPEGNNAGRAVSPAVVLVSRTATSTPRVTPTLTPRATFTATPTPAHTTTATAAAKPTARPAAETAPRLLAPNADITGAGLMAFSWSWDDELAENQAFEVRIWKEGSADHPGAAQLVTQPAGGAWRQVIDVSQAPAVQAGGSGTYFWSAALVEIDPYSRIGPEAPPRRLYVQG